MHKFTYTVFTPTYNRAHLLPVLFDSLRRQTFADFEWVIVDDGSSDDTIEVVDAFKERSPFPITFLVQEHGGKHKGINLGVRVARGRLFGIADSDDYFLDDALATCLRHYENIPPAEKGRFAGVTGLCVTETGDLVGSSFPSSVYDSDALELVSKRVTGDKAGFIRTEVMKEFPFPENMGSFVPEALVWNRMAARYKTRYFNHVIMVRDYQCDGLSSRIAQIRAGAPRSSCTYYLELLRSERRFPIDLTLRYCSNYVRFSLHNRTALKNQIAAIASSTLFATAAPVGLALYCLDKYKMKKPGQSATFSEGVS